MQAQTGQIAATLFPECLSYLWWCDSKQLEKHDGLFILNSKRQHRRFNPFLWIKLNLSPWWMSGYVLISDEDLKSWVSVWLHVKKRGQQFRISRKRSLHSTCTLWATKEFSVLQWEKKKVCSSSNTRRTAKLTFQIGISFLRKLYIIQFKVENDWIALNLLCTHMGRLSPIYTPTLLLFLSGPANTNWIKNWGPVRNALIFVWWWAKTKHMMVQDMNYRRFDLCFIFSVSNTAINLRKVARGHPLRILMIQVNATMMKHWKIFRTEFRFSREYVLFILKDHYYKHEH